VRIRSSGSARRSSPRSHGILTNKPVRISVRILEGLGLAKYFRRFTEATVLKKKAGPARLR